MIDRNDPCFCGSGKKWKKCHYPDAGGDTLAKTYLKQFKIVLKNPEQIAGIKKACKLTANILDELCRYAKAGITTNQLDALCAKLTAEAGAIAAPLHYGSPPYPKSICTSLNDVVCHGIPNDIPLREGDICNIDVSCILDGFYGDCSRMVVIGKTTADRQLVVEVSKMCLDEAIKILKPGALLSDIGAIIEKIATANTCSVVHQFVGHGVGIKFHEPPQIPHYRNDIHLPLAAGMTFTIEPMINAGVPEAALDPKNQWEARTKDGKPSAQWEHTLLITAQGYEILTLPG